MCTNQETRYESWPQLCFRGNSGWIRPDWRERENDVLAHPLLLKTQQPLKRLAADFSQLTNALSMLVVRVYDISSIEWFCCYGKSAKKGCISCRAQILWVFNVQFLLRTLRIIPLILNCLNVETYGLVCCSLGNNCLNPSCQIQINSDCRNRESAAAQQNFKKSVSTKRQTWRIEKC